MNVAKLKIGFLRPSKLEIFISLAVAYFFVAFLTEEFFWLLGMGDIIWLIALVIWLFCALVVFALLILFVPVIPKPLGWSLGLSYGLVALAMFGDGGVLWFFYAPIEMSSRSTLFTYGAWLILAAIGLGLWIMSEKITRK